MPSHRALALLRGRNEGILQVALVLDSELDAEAIKPGTQNPCEQRIAARFGIKPQNRPADKWLADTVRWTWKVKVYTHLELELVNELRERAEEEAIRVFGRNLQGPAARRAGRPARRPWASTPASAPAARSPSSTPPASCSTPPPSTRTNRAATGMARCPTIARLAAKHSVTLVAIGNGTASRETDKLVQDVMKRYPEARLTKIVVSEAGASVYSASELRRQGIPRSRRLDPRRRLDCPPPAGSAGRTGQDRSRNPSASASTSTTSRKPSWRAISMPSSRTASTPSAST